MFFHFLIGDFFFHKHNFQLHIYFLFSRDFPTSRTDQSINIFKFKISIDYEEYHKRAGVIQYSTQLKEFRMMRFKFCYIFHFTFFSLVLLHVEKRVI